MARLPAPPHCRLLPDSLAAGPWQMAADEVMLAGAIRGTASLRFYRWSEPTLSLGYFQPVAARRSDPLLADLPFVRRATGGGALVHDLELTYALALPPGEPWQRRSEPWLARMHGIIAAAFARLGIEAKSVTPSEQRKLGEVLCFLDQTPGDLLLHGDKIVGSAQRRTRGALLQHGGIILARSRHTPQLPGPFEPAELTPHVYARVRQAVVVELVARCGWFLEPDEWTVEEVARCEELARVKYGTNSWNAKR